MITSITCRRATILVKLQKDDPSALKFEPGDHLGIYPCNDSQMVRGGIKMILLPKISHQRQSVEIA